MAKNRAIDLDRSLRDNAGALLLDLLGETTSYRREVVAHPKRIDVLHEMRIAGRPLRYLMEAFAPAFGRPFAKRLKEVKGVLDIAGEVHDCDILIDMLSGQIGKPARAGGKSGPGSDIVRDVRIARLLATQRVMRKKKFRELCAGLGALSRGRFKKKLLQSIRQPV